MTQKAYEFEVEVTRKVRLGYLVHLPTGHGDDPEKKWPLIFFLHGRGERGDDLELLKLHGIAKVVEERDDFPFVAVSPQCSRTSLWQVEVDGLNALLDGVLKKYAVDEKRVYLTGLSMGGFGTWQLGISYPERFAAIAPICGGGDPSKVCALENVPTWVFHGALDPTVPLQRSEDMVEALKACGGDVRFTVYPDLEHDSWTRTYDDPALYEWLLQHKLG